MIITRGREDDGGHLLRVAGHRAALRSGAVKGLAAADLSCGVSRSDGSAAIDASGADVLAPEPGEYMRALSFQGQMSIVKKRGG